jgi:hypothetical protein
MKYETPELTALTPAINAIKLGKITDTPPVDSNENEDQGAYQDWE